MAQTRAKRIASAAVLLAVPLFPFALCGGLYACSRPPAEAAHAFMRELRAKQAPPYPLAPSDPADAAYALRVIASSTDFTVWNFSVKGTGGSTRACLFGRLSLPDGGRWMDVALEQSGDAWRVRDMSFDRDCNSGKRGDMRLH